MATARRSGADRYALWALLLALFALVVAAASAHAASGGVSAGGESASPSDTVTGAPPTEFGSRVLSVGTEGDDVAVLNGIVKSKAYSASVRLTSVFDTATKDAVQEFQRAAGLPDTGVAEESTATALTRSMSRAGATWYGPGFYGHRTACDTVLRTTTIGVAHRSLPCGTKVTLAYHGHYLVVPVIDRGPYTASYKFDLTSATAEALGVTTSTRLRYAIARTGSDVRGL